MIDPANDKPGKMSAALRRKITKANIPPPQDRPQKPCEVLPFPAVFQEKLLREVDAVAEWPSHDAAMHLGKVLARHRRKLQNFGVADDKIAADVADLRNAFGIPSNYVG